MKGDQGCCSNDNRGNRPQTKTTMASPASFPPLDPNEAKLGPKSVSAVLVVSCCLVLLSAFLSFSYNGEFFQAVDAHSNASLLLSKLFSSSQTPHQNTEAQRRKLLEMPLHNEAASMRIFGPVIDAYDNANNAGNNDISYSWYTRAQQRQFLVNHSHECWPFQSSKAGKHVGGGDSNQLVERFDQLASAPFLQTELWKYCAFYSGVGNIFWDRSQMVPAITWEDLWQHSGSEQYTALIVTPPATSTATTKSSFATAASASSWIHPSFLRLDSTKAKQLSQTMIRLLMETEDTLLTSSNALYFYQALAQHIQSDKAWSTWDAQCQVPSPQNPTDQVLVKRHSNNKKTKTVAVSRQRHLEIDNDATPPKFSSLPTYGLHCTMLGGYCCQVWKDDLPEMPVMILQHPFGTTGGTSSAVVSTSTQQTHRYLPSSDEDMSMYWSTITAVPTADANKAVSKLETPNFFDILLQNNCLPTSEECHRCLKRYTSTTGCDDQCRQDCPCYCKVLCQIRPPSKHIKAVWYVSPPLYQPQRPLPPRLIPRIIHQTWYVLLLIISCICNSIVYFSHPACVLI